MTMREIGALEHLESIIVVMEKDYIACGLLDSVRRINLPNSL
jgi:hypothetical protein